MESTNTHLKSSLNNFKLNNLICLSYHVNSKGKNDEFGISDINKLYASLYEYKDLEFNILQKCNCTEIYLYGNFSPYVIKVIELWKKSVLNKLQFHDENIRSYRGLHCIKHLIETSVGVHSVTLGDSQVLSQVNWYGKKMYLRQSNQLYKQILIQKGFNIDLYAIIHYPKTIKKFYTQSFGKDFTDTFDIIFRGWEISSGALRQLNTKEMKDQMSQMKINYNKYKFYMDLLHTGRPHGGFCLGIDRILTKIFNGEHINEFILFPRTNISTLP